MKETYSKNYFEKYAALTLTKVLNISADKIIQDDRPDLRIPELDFGIEVTQALTQLEAVADIKKPLYGTLKLNPFDHSEKDLTFVINKIDNALKRKEQKSKNYQVYPNNGLYIFSHCHNLSEIILLQYFEQINLSNSFYQHIFINCVDRLYHYHCAKKELITFNYNFHELSLMNQTAIEFERYCPKKRRKINIVPQDNEKG